MDLINVQLPGYQGLQKITIRAGLISAIQPMPESPLLASETLDLKGDWLSLGGMDLQINGALGLAFPELQPGDESKLAEICDFLWAQGVDAFLPTLVTTSLENFQRSLGVLAQFMAQPTDHPTAKILGAHLEGPFLNPAKRGAHPEQYLLPLTLENVKRVVGDYAGIVKVMTLAPELDETGEVLDYLRSQQIIISLGHSQATAAQAQQAFNQGASMVTHAFNAMPPLHHREPGLLGAAIAHPQVQCGLIADGQHVNPLMIDLLLRASRYDQGIFLVSDALAPLGLPDGLYPWDTRQIEVIQGTARLPDGTLSGTTLPLLAGVQNLVKWGLCNTEIAIALATLAPRHAIGLMGDNPYLNQPAHFLHWSTDLTSGKLTWSRLQLPEA